MGVNFYEEINDFMNIYLGVHLGSVALIYQTF